MHDIFDGEQGVFDFDEIANHMLEQGVDSSPSAVHGCLCGLLAAGAKNEAEVCLDALSAALDLNVHGELADQVMQLYRITAAALQDDEFDFHPLLPDDEVEIVARTGELVAWCKGFLAGFAHVSVAADKDASALSQKTAARYSRTWQPLPRPASTTRTVKRSWKKAIWSWWSTCVSPH